MSKILILANYDVGLYKFRRELIEELLKKHQVYISLPKGEYTTELEKMGCFFIETEVDRRGTNPIRDFGLIKAYKKIMEIMSPDIVLSYTIKPNVYGGFVTQLLDIPFIPNVTGFGSAVENGGLLKQISLVLYKLGLRKAKTVFFQNESNLQLAKNYKLIKENYKLIPGSGVNLEHFSLLEYPPEDTIEFVFISRIMKEKGIDQYLEAAEYITKKYPNTKFHVCGFCEDEYEEILADYQNNGIIEYHGMLDDVREILKNTHCTVHPTYYPEGLSNVLLESAASGRPIISTDRSGTRETIDNGVNGFLIKERNTEDLIEKIEKFITLSFKEKYKMGIRGREKVEYEFNRNIVIEKYLEEIKSIRL